MKRAKFSITTMSADCSTENIAEKNMKKIGNISMDPAVLVDTEVYALDIDNAKKIAKVLIEEKARFEYVSAAEGGENRFTIKVECFGTVADLLDIAKYRRCKFKAVVTPVI